MVNWQHTKCSKFESLLFYGVGNPTERAYKYMPADKSTKLDYVIDADSPDGVVLGDGDGSFIVNPYNVS